MATRTFPDANPHGELTQLFDDVFFVTGGYRVTAPLPLSFSRNMTVIRDGDDLTLINSVRLNDHGLAELDKLGTVKHIIRLAGFHGSDDPFYKERYGADVWAVEGQVYAPGIDPAATMEKAYFKADMQMSRHTELPIRGAKLYPFTTARPPEALLLLERNDGILVSGDCLQNWRKPDQYFSFLARPMMRMMGFIKPHNIGPGWLKIARPDVREIQGILPLEFAHVLPAHGEITLGDAKQRYRRAIEKLDQPAP